MPESSMMLGIGGGGLWSPKDILSLVAYWAMEETSGNRIDATGRGNDLAPTLVGGAIAGVVANGADMTNDAGANLKRASTVDLTTGDIDWTIWFWFNGDGGGGNNATIAGKYSAFVDPTATEWLLRHFGGGFGLYLSDGVALVSVSGYQDNKGAPYGLWHLLVAFHDATHKVFGIRIDDLKANETMASYTATARSGSDGFRIGGGLGESTFTGIYDEGGFARGILTDTEIKNLLNQGNGATLPNTVPTATRKTYILFGTSIAQGYLTAVGGAQTYHYKLATWLASNFASDNLFPMNAGEGSQSTIWGLIHFDHDALTHNPKLIVLEYLVNDTTTFYKFALEAIVRRIRTELPTCKILGVLNGRIANPAVDDPTNTFQTQYDDWKAVLDHYSIPYADWMTFVQGDVPLNHPLSFYFQDVVHWTADGHTLCATLLEAQLADLNPPASVPSPLFTDSADLAHGTKHKYGSDYDSKTGTWTESGYMLSSTDTATPATITYSGTFRAYAISAEPILAGATMNVSIDGGAFANKTVGLGIDVGSYGAHTITIKVTAGTSPVNILNVWMV